MGYTITLIAGLILAATSLYLLKRSLNFIKNSERATATVVGLEHISDNDGTTYKAIFKFKTYNNQEITYRQNGSTSPASWAIGDQAQICYQRNDPSSAKLLTYWGSFAWTIVLLAIAMPLLVVGGGYYIARSFLK